MLIAAKSNRFTAGVVWEHMAVISPPSTPPSRDHMITELMSGPDEELGMNESPSRRLSGGGGVSFKTLRISFKKKGCRHAVGCKTYLEAFLTSATESDHSRVQKTSLGFTMRVTITHGQVTRRWVYAPRLDIFSENPVLLSFLLLWMCLPVCRSSTWWPSLSRRPMRRRRK